VRVDEFLAKDFAIFDNDSAQINPAVLGWFGS
jgi:hypothetical protein